MPRPPARAVRRRLVYLAIASTLAALVWAACSQSSGPELAAGRITCEPLTNLESYRYQTEVTFDLAERDPSLEPTDPYDPAPFSLTQIVEGAVQRDGKVDATTRTAAASGSETNTIVIGDQAWLQPTGFDWVFIDLTTSPFPIVYFPLDTCNAVAPDIDVSAMTGQLEDVGDVPSLRYSFDSLSSRLLARHPSFGPQSDAGRLISEFQGDIWIAEEDRYITRLELEGTGAYENGRPLTVKIFLEVSDQNDDSIRIEAPPVTPEASN